MKKDKRIIAIIAIAAALAVAAGSLIYVFLAPRRTTMYIFKENYAAGTVIDSSMLTPVQVDANIIVAGSTADTSSCFITKDNWHELQAGTTLKVDVSRGDPFMSAQLSNKSATAIESRMSEQSVCVTVPITAITGVTNDLQPECRVNVYVTYNSGGTLLLLENMRIIALSYTNGALSGATLELTPEQAPALIGAANSGTLYFGLVDGDGYMYQNSDNSALPNNTQQDGDDTPSTQPNLSADDTTGNNTKGFEAK